MNKNKEIEELLDACSSYDLQKVKKLVESGINVNEAGHSNRRAICAGGKGNQQIEIAEYLLSKGADVNAPCYEGNSALSLTAYECDSVYLKWLLDNGADPHWKSTDTGETALHTATVKGRSPESTACVKLLLAAGIDPNTQNIPNIPTGAFWRDVMTSGETPLHFAVSYGSEEMIILLLESGADPSIKDIHGKSPLAKFSLFQRDLTTPTSPVDLSIMCRLAYTEDLKKSVSYWNKKNNITHI